MFITRKHEFDMGHRVMNENVHCWSDHGHRYFLEITLSFDSVNKIGYAIDFKEIKRVFFSFIDYRFDHGKALNPKDTILIDACRKIIHPLTKEHSKLHLMNLLGENGDCNPTAENLAKELFYAGEKLLNDKDNCNLKVVKIKLKETPNCYVECVESDISTEERRNLDESSYAVHINNWKNELGRLEYDVRNFM